MDKFYFILNLDLDRIVFGSPSREKINEVAKKILVKSDSRYIIVETTDE